MTTKSALRRGPKSRHLQGIPDPKKRQLIASSRAGFGDKALRQKYSITDLLRSGTDAPGPAQVRILMRAAFLGSSLDHQHDDVRKALKLPQDFVLHSCRHSMLTRLGEAGADAFTIMRIAGHSSVTVSQRYVHPTPEGMERAFERLEKLNAVKFEQSEAEAQAAAAGVNGVGTNLGTVENGRKPKPSQVVEFKKTGA